jgi:hypothetical protein
LFLGPARIKNQGGRKAESRRGSFGVTARAVACEGGKTSTSTSTIIPSLSLLLFENVVVLFDFFLTGSLFLGMKAKNEKKRPSVLAESDREQTAKST